MIIDALAFASVSSLAFSVFGVVFWLIRDVIWGEYRSVGFHVQYFVFSFVLFFVCSFVTCLVLR